MITGKIFTRHVFIEGNFLDPIPSQKIYNHSPDGFAWGYGGSGPAQLALAILLHFTNERFATDNYQLFKWEVIAKLSPNHDFELTSSQVRAWCKAAGYKPDEVPELPGAHA